MTYLREYTGLKTIPESKEELQLMVKRLLLKKAGEELSKLTGGIITRIPTSLEDAKWLATEVMIKQGMHMWTRYTGLKRLPEDISDLQHMATFLLLRKGGETLSKMTNGIITRIPTDLEDAKALALEIVQTQGTPYWTKYTGLDAIPTNEAELKTMAIELAARQGAAGISRATGGVVTKIPVTLDEARAMADELIKKEGRALYTSLTGLSNAPSSQAELHSMVHKLALKAGGDALTQLTGGLITRIPSSLEDAKTMAAELIQKKGMPFFTNFTNLTKVPTTEAELKTMALTLAKREAEKQLGELTHGLITEIPTTVEGAKEMAKEVVTKLGMMYLTNWTGLTKLPEDQEDLKRMIKGFSLKAPTRTQSTRHLFDSIPFDTVISFHSPNHT